MLQAIAPGEVQITWDPQTHASFWEDMTIGDSIAVDGICLTVTKILPDCFQAAVSPETLDRTRLGALPGNAIVNLESSLRVGSKIGGHFVTGHIDGVGYFQNAKQTVNSWEMTFSAPDPRVARYIVSKGSIAINGVSLTIADCDQIGTQFTVAVIPLTYQETNLRHLTPNTPVNLEGDVLGKYVEKFLRLMPPSTSDAHHQALAEFGAIANGTGTPLANHQSDSDLTSDFLAEHGYG